MKRVLALLFIVPLVFCIEDLPDAKDLLNMAKNVSCEDFTAARPNTKCCNYTGKWHFTTFFQRLLYSL